MKNVTHAEFGIAGMPRGGTHFAADFFGLSHEHYDPAKRGVCDYLLATPVRHPRRQNPYLLTTNFEFEKRLTVMRDPMRVVITNQEMNEELQRRVLTEAGATPWMLVTTPLDWWLQAVMAHYEKCLDWSDGAIVYAECLNPRKEQKDRRVSVWERNISDMTSTAVYTAFQSFRAEHGYE